MRMLLEFDSLNIACRSNHPYERTAVGAGALDVRHTPWPN